MAVTHRLKGPGWSMESHAGEYTASQSKGHRPSLAASITFHFPLLCVRAAEPGSLHLCPIGLLLAYSLHSIAMTWCSSARVKKLFPWSFQSYVKLYLLSLQENSHSLSKCGSLASGTCNDTRVLGELTWHWPDGTFLFFKATACGNSVATFKRYQSAKVLFLQGPMTMFSADS